VALKHGHGRELLPALFDDLVRLIDQPFPTDNVVCFSIYAETAALMLAHDRGRATDVLLAPQRFHARHHAIADVLTALVNAGEVVPPQQLLPLIEDVWRVERRRPDAVRSMLRLAARTEDPGCRAHIDAALYSSDDKLRAQAVPAWAEANALPCYVADGHLYDFRDARVPAVVRRWSAAHFFASWQGSSGIHDPAGDDDELLPLALQGMSMAGAEQCAAAVRKAAELVRQEGAKFDDPRVRAQASEFRAHEDDLKVKLMRIAIDHREQFLQAEAMRIAAKASKA